MSEIVLIVDDDPVQRRLLEAMVTRFGYQALTASRAAMRAWRCYRRGRNASTAWCSIW